MRRHGAKPRKDGARYPGGQLRYAADVDPGHAMTLEHRARIVGWEHAQDPRADHTLGQALLRGYLEEPGQVSDDTQAEAERRYAAGLDFAALHFVLWGKGTPPSHLKNAIAGMRSSAAPSEEDNTLAAALRFGRLVAQIRRAAPDCGPVYPYHVLQRVVLDEGPVATDGTPDIELLSPAERRALRLALNALCHRDRPKRAIAAAPKTPRVRGLDIRFDRAADGPDSQALARAIERLKAGLRPAG